MTMRTPPLFQLLPLKTSLAACFEHSAYKPVGTNSDRTNTDTHAAGFVLLRFATTNANPNINSENNTRVAIDAASDVSVGTSG